MEAIIMEAKNNRNGWTGIALRFSPPVLGPYYLGAYHVHKCQCGRMTTGVGKSLCPECAARNYSAIVMQTKAQRNIVVPANV